MEARLLDLESAQPFMPSTALLYFLRRCCAKNPRRGFVHNWVLTLDGPLPQLVVFLKVRESSRWNDAFLHAVKTRGMGHYRPQDSLTTHFIPWNESGPYDMPTWNNKQLGDAYLGKKPASWRGSPLVGTIGATKTMQKAKATRQATSSFRLVILSSWRSRLILRAFGRALYYRRPLVLTLDLDPLFSSLTLG